MELRLVLHIAAVGILVTASLTAIVDQSGRLVGVQEISPLVLERVQLTREADRPRWGEIPHAH